MTETWFSNNVPNALICFNGYGTEFLGVIEVLMAVELLFILKITFTLRWLKYLRGLIMLR